MNDNNIDIENQMNPIHSYLKKNNSMNNEEDIIESQSLKPKGILVNNHKESYENWFVDTIVRTGLFVFASIVFLPIIILGIYFSFKKYSCNTHIININLLLLCAGIKNLIAYIILGSRLYAESSLTTVSDRTITHLKRMTKFHLFYEIVFNTFIVYSISSSKVSNCDSVPFTYLIIYLVINFFGIFLYLISSFHK
jgi:hypothetical protein